MNKIEPVSAHHRYAAFFRKSITPRSRQDRIWLFVRLLLACLLLLCFFCTPELFSKTSDGVTHYLKKRMLAVPAVCLLLILVPARRLQLPAWCGAALNILVAFGMPFLALMRAEKIHGFHLLHLLPKRILFNMILAMAVFLLFHILTNRVKASAFLTYLLIVFFSAMNYYVNIFRGEPINAADVYVAGTALNVAEAYTFTLTWELLKSLLEGFALLALLNWLPAEEMVLHRWKRLIWNAAAACAVIFTIQLFTTSVWPLKQGIKVKTFDPMQTYQRNGQLLNFVRSFYYMKVREPENYSRQTVRTLMEETGFTSDPVCADGSSKLPNIIVIMNESLTDFSEYPLMEMSEDPLAFFHSLENSPAPNVITGDLHVDVFGGKTADTEYEFLTGNSVAFMPGNAIPYALYVRRPQPSVIWNMRDMHYSGCAAFHPYLANGYSRPRAYPNLGFEEFISLETIENTLTDADYLRGWVSDRADFQKIIDFYETARAGSDAPFCLFNVTMQNHGGYASDYENMEMDITLGGALKDNRSAQRFINLMRYSDQAFRELTEYFEKQTDPTVLVMFGDHQPNLHRPFYPTIYGKAVRRLTSRERFGRYETPLVIWANYEINPDGMYDDVFDEISINYLSAALMQAAGVPMTAYQKFLVKMQQEIPVFTGHGYLDSKNHYYEVWDTESPHYSLVEIYHAFAYNNQFDAKGREDSFFSLSAEDHLMPD